jgi:hypothetical protein
MTMYARRPANDGGDYESPPDGSFPATLVAVIDLGTQEDDYKGVIREARKVFLGFELHGETKQDGSPHVVGRAYTLSLAEKAALTPVAKALLRREIQPDEEIEMPSLLGKPCIVAMAPVTSGDKVYINFAGIQPPMKGMTIAKPTLPLTYWDLECGKPFPAGPWLPRLYGKSLATILSESKERRGKAPQANADEDVPF